MIHEQAHPLAGQTVALSVAQGAEHQLCVSGADFRIEDWWDRVSGCSWMFAQGNPACLNYAMRSAIGGIPIDNEVVYGKVDHLGYLVHVSELGPAPSDDEPEDSSC